LGDNNKIQNIQ